MRGFVMVYEINKDYFAGMQDGMKRSANMVKKLSPAKTSRFVDAIIKTALHEEMFINQKIKERKITCR